MGSFTTDFWTKAMKHRSVISLTSALKGHRSDEVVGEEIMVIPFEYAASKIYRCVGA